MSEVIKLVERSLTTAVRSAVLIDRDSHAAECRTNAPRHVGFDPIPVALEFVDHDLRHHHLQLTALGEHTACSSELLTRDVLGKIEPDACVGKKAQHIATVSDGSSVIVGFRR